jgi:hypothetical protein
MNQQVITTLSIEELKELLSQIVRDELKAIKEEDFEDKLISQQAAIGLFDPEISRVTFYNYEKQGLIQPHYIGNKKYYKKSEIFESTKKIKKYSRS